MRIKIDGIQKSKDQLAKERFNRKAYDLKNIKAFNFQNNQSFDEAFKNSCDKYKEQI